MAVAPAQTINITSKEIDNARLGAIYTLLVLRPLPYRMKEEKEKTWNTKKE